MKKQIVIIHGGNPFGSYREYISYLKRTKVDFERYKSERRGWKRALREDLGGKFEIVLPEMPSKLNAKYFEWKLWFKKLIPYFKSGVILVGHSLGGIFLAKYLSKNKLPKTICAVFLVAAPYGTNNKPDHFLGDFVLPRSLKKLEKQAKKIFLYYSKDDPIVPFADLGKYREKLKGAVVRIFADKGHFGQRSFPELIKDIKSL